MKIALLGECMVELSLAEDGHYALGHGGDTLNTAVYLARLGVAADYVTVLGEDPLSASMLASWESEGVGTGHVLRLPGRLPGLYMIRRDEHGERSFLYWRDRAPVRELFEHPGAAAVFESLERHDWLYLSGITASLFAPRHLDHLIARLDALRAAGCRIAFDGNYRPAGWPDLNAARHAFGALLARTDLALPTLDDEQALWGDADAAACIARMREKGVAEIAVKCGPNPAVIATESGITAVPAAAHVRPKDTTAAGDSFNAGYLAARFAGLAPAEAAQRGHRLAAVVVMHPGAIIPRAAMPA